jgi:hypothetical protein
VYYNNEPSDDWELREEGLNVADLVVEQIKNQLSDELDPAVSYLSITQ